MRMTTSPWIMLALAPRRRAAKRGAVLRMVMAMTDGARCLAKSGEARLP